jgi:hypothetical protein
MRDGSNTCTQELESKILAPRIFGTFQLFMVFSWRL